jgi:hypothetical protein
MSADQPIYECITEAEKFATLTTSDPEDLDTFMDGFEGEPLSATWEPIAVEFIREDVAEKGLLVPDIASVSGLVPVLSPRAADALGEMISAHAELLELESSDEHSWLALNVIRLCDVMDEAASSARYHEPGCIMTLERLALKSPLRAPLPPIFKLPQWPHGSPLITQEFIDAAATHGLTGLDPRPVTKSP